MNNMMHALLRKSKINKSLDFNNLIYGKILLMSEIFKYINKIEHLKYDKRLPLHATIFENKQNLSNIIWDIHGHNACQFYKKKNPNSKESIIKQNGYVTGKLSKKKTEALQKIFNSCKKINFEPFDFHSDYVYEPRENLHQDMIRINDYYQPSEYLFKNLPKIFDPLSKIIERENGFYFKVASLRVFSVKPNEKTQGFHTDAQPFAIKKFFFYPYGANKDIGSTNIINKKNKKEIIHLDPGSWMMFENNVVEHQAYSHFKVITRPTIEIDIMADFETDTTLNFNGINSWYPWFPLYDNKNDYCTSELNYKYVYERNLQRLMGLSKINKSESYKFPCDFKDTPNKKYIFETSEDEKTSHKNINQEIKSIVQQFGVTRFMLKLFIILPTIVLKKIFLKN